jgi:hypothetical protein
MKHPIPNDIDQALLQLYGVGPNDNKSPQAFAPLTSALVDERAKALLTPDDFDASGKLLPGKVPTAFEEKSASFTAQNGGHYRTTGTITVTDSPSPVAGHYYVVLVQSGTATIGGTGFGPSRVPVYRYYNGTTWVTLGPEGEVVGTTAAQTLTNKTLQSPNISSGPFVLTPGGVSLWSANIYTPTIYDPHIRFTQQTSSFTAQTYRHYATAGTVTVTDPASPSEGHYYLVLVQSGTATIGGVAFGPSRFPIYRYYNGSSWVTLPVSLATDATLNGPNNTAPNQTAASASSLMTRALCDARHGIVPSMAGVPGSICLPVSLADMGASSSSGGQVDSNRGRRRIRVTVDNNSQACLSFFPLLRNSSNNVITDHNTGIMVACSTPNIDGVIVGLFWGGLTNAPNTVNMDSLDANGVSWQMRRNGANIQGRFVSRLSPSSFTADPWVNVFPDFDNHVILVALTTSGGNVANVRVRSLFSPPSSSWIYSATMSRAFGTSTNVGMAALNPLNPSSGELFWEIYSVFQIQGELP